MRDATVCAILILTVLPVTIVADSTGSSAQLSRNWWTLGPFPSGKIEYDGDPLEAHGGAFAALERGPGASVETSKGKDEHKESFLAEHAVGGRVSWMKVKAKVTGAYYGVEVPHTHVPFENLWQNPPLAGPMDIVHVQSWVFGSIKVKVAGRFAIDCDGLHTFQLMRVGANASMGPFAGNIYRGSAKMHSVYVDLLEGKYKLGSRVRGKAPLNFRCRIQPIGESPIHADIRTENQPDVVLGQLISMESFLDVRVRNPGATWLDVTGQIVNGSIANGFRVGGAPAQTHLGPGAATQLPVPVTLKGEHVEREKDVCAQLEIVLSAQVGGGGSTFEIRLPVKLRCRLSTQSALMSFKDADGSVGMAAVIRPRTPPMDITALPIVVSFSGVGAKPQDQADAYKMKPSPNYNGDFIFGFEALWVLAPQRGGPHNWEDVGMRTALRAIDVLAESTVAPPHAHRDLLIVHGHSRGGHGAWGLATRIPDRVLAVASACGWYSREEYGDANNLWVHDTSLMHLDKALLGLLQGSIGANENSLHASNLRGTRALVRVASRDTAVPPWFGRRMARHMLEEGVNVTLEEHNQEHWWWDSKMANDGGVMHDATMRSWTLEAAKSGAVTLDEVLAGGELIVASSGPEYAGRFGIRVIQQVSPSARAFIRIKHAGSNILLRTVNVQRIAVAAGSAAAVAMAGVANADGSLVHFDVADGVELCRVLKATSCLVVADSSEGDCHASLQSTGRRWQACDTGTGAPPLTRGLSLLGPIRQVFAAPWVIVLPELPSDLEVRLAAYFASGHMIAYETATQILRQSHAAAYRTTHRFVWIGEATRLPSSVSQAWPLRIGQSEESSTLSLGPCIFGAGHAAAFLAPAPTLATSDGLLDLVLTATDAKSLENLISFSFATNQAHTRAPMSNMLPDFFVTGPEFRWRGYGGVVAAGYWAADWQVAEHSAYFAC